MPDPTVACIMLTADRPEYARRAVEAFRRQTYPAKRLLIYDTGRNSETIDLNWDGGDMHVFSSARGEEIGLLRNYANRSADADILVHWDDDDYSHPNRIAEQVALLQSSGAEAVGYREILFWQEGVPLESYEINGLNVRTRSVDIPGEAWLYTNGLNSYCLGTSLCYWRKTWERRPFEARPSKAEPWTSEDAVWLQGVRSVGVSAGEMMKPWATVSCECGNRYPRSGAPCSKCQAYPDDKPRMVARIHPGNTSQAYNPALMRASEMQGDVWKRVPAWDDYCARLMK